MITFHIESYTRLVDLIRGEERAAGALAVLPQNDDPDSSPPADYAARLMSMAGLGASNPVSASDRQRIAGLGGYATKKCEELEMESGHNRLERLLIGLKNPALNYSELAQLLRTLREALEDDGRTKHFYYYPKAKAHLLIVVPGDWEPALKAFSESGGDITSAIDCYATGHNLASVFHLMRVMEFGVQKFGKKLGVSLTKKSKNRLIDLTWHAILDALNPKLNAMPQKTLATKAKHEKYCAIQSYLYAVKDAWRNPTMHPRRIGYSDLETLNLVNHVKTFMNGLAEIVSQ